MGRLVFSLVMLMFSTQALSEDYKSAYFDSTIEVAKLLRHKTILENFVGEQYIEIKLLTAQLQSMKELNQQTLHRQIALGEICPIYSAGDKDEQCKE